MPDYRYKMTVAYDGTDFHGWQEQKMPDAQPLRTAQGVLKNAVLRTVKQPTYLIGASRTDAGVHAIGQVAQFNADTPIPLERLATAINSKLDHDIEVRDVQIVQPDFDVIQHAIDKQYRYRIWNHTRRPLHLRTSVYHYWVPLDVDAMQNAAQRLVGTHDFAAFANADDKRETTIRTVNSCHIEIAEPEIHIVISGSGFLYNMVRIITGTLIEIGRGHWQPDRIDQLLEHRLRKYAGPTIPPRGLCLEWIKHNPEKLIPPPPNLPTELPTNTSPKKKQT